MPTIGIYLTDQEYRDIAKVADKENMPVSQFVAELVRVYIKEGE